MEETFSISVEPRRRTNTPAPKPKPKPKEIKMADLTAHDAWLDIFNVRVKDLMAMLEMTKADSDKLGTNNKKMARIMEQLQDNIDAVTAQVIIAQKYAEMKSGKV